MFAQKYQSKPSALLGYVDLHFLVYRGLEIVISKLKLKKVLIKLLTISIIT